MEGLLVGTLTLLAYSIGFFMFGTNNSLLLGRTMAFCTLSFCEIAHAVNMRSNQPLFKAGILSNRMMNLAVAVCVVFQCTVVLIPKLAEIFGVISLTGTQWLIVAGLSIIPLLVGETGKTACSMNRGDLS
jgi:Ca2+-transporting ATPase